MCSARDGVRRWAWVLAGCLLVLQGAQARQPTVAAMATSPALRQPATPPISANSLRDDWCKRLRRVLRSVTAQDCRQPDWQVAEQMSVRQLPIMVRDVPAEQPRKSSPLAAVKARAQTASPPPSKIAREAAPQTLSRATPSVPVRVLLIGGIHGDELTATAIVFRWMAQLDSGAGRRHTWRIVPLLNPDGMLSKPARRTNANGVDLNRNFPTPGWEREAPLYWERKTHRDPRRYPGTQPLSEPESQWLHQQIESYQPDVIVSVHAPFGVLDFDGPAKPPQRLGRLFLDRVGVYPGSLGNYSGVFRQVPVITIELPHATSMPSAEEVRHIWTDMQAWIDRYAQEGLVAVRQLPR